MRITRHNKDAWRLSTSKTEGVRVRRRGGPRDTSAIPQAFLLKGVDVALTRDALPPPARRGMAAPLEIEVACEPEERAVIAMRLPSGALTFHAPVERVRTRGARQADAGGVERFRIAVAPATPEPESGRVRRGLVSKAVKLFVLKVQQHLIDAAVSMGTALAVQGLERLWWKAHGLEEGWRRVDAATLRAKLLTPVNVPKGAPGDRALLFIHGTFSNAASAFGPLATAPGDFFSAIRALYGDRVYAFDHFSLSKSPADNARALLEELPAGCALRFDVITHSRGGLVLRHLVERREVFGALADRFQLGRVILVASPNAGTPLATPSRWEQTVGLMANVLEMFPDNPWTTGAEFVANGIVWLAGHLSHDLPGLASMDGHGEVIDALQSPPGPPPGAYAALVANYAPEGAVLARLLDAGVDGFFAGANDLVVPTEGGWQVDSGDRAIAADRVGCYGPGGNLPPPDGAPIMHLNFFGQRSTVDFLVRTLRGDTPATASVVDLDRPLPVRRLFRGAAPGAAPQLARAMAADAAEPLGPGAPQPRSPRAPAARRPAFVDEGDDTLQLMVLQGRDGVDSAQIVASYGSARVVQPFPTRDPQTTAAQRGKQSLAANSLDAAGSRFQRIIAIHERISMTLDGRVPKGAREAPELPNDGELREFGTLLFDALFHHDVKRLYDVARSEQRDRALNVIFTCTIPWVAAKPWEFAYDPARRKFLVTEEVHFVRNVFTPVPAQRPPLDLEALRMLVVVAQPLGTVELSAAEEEARIRGSFRMLMESGLVEIAVLTHATPARLHHVIEAREIESRAVGQTRPYHIVHFIGHGAFDREANQGTLLFTTGSGETHPMKTRELREVLCNRGIQLVFLNACDTARDATDTSNRGVAQALVEGGLPAVVANQYKVLDPSAMAFADHFYWSLAHGASLGEAARESRIALNYALDGESIDWAVPVLHARDPDLRLCRLRERVAMPSALTPEVGSVARPATTAARSTAVKGLIRVAVADLTQAYPGLEDVAARLNAVQQVAEFTLVRLVLPLGIWRDTDQGPYLNADRFAERLLDRQKELATDYLICITDRPLVGTIKLPGKSTNRLGRLVENLFAWGDPDGEHKIFVLSTAGFPIPPRGIVTSRVFTNLLVGTLADDLLQAHVRENVVHDRPPRNCPFYYNPERDFELLGARMRFDATCRKRFERHLPLAQRRAIETMLQTFFDDQGLA